MSDQAILHMAATGVYVTQFDWHPPMSIWPLIVKVLVMKWPNSL